MKKQFLKKTGGSVIAIVALTLLFVLAQSVTAQSVTTRINKGRKASIEKFQLSSPGTGSILGSLYQSSPAALEYLRVYGDTILSSVIINQDAKYGGIAREERVFNVGYSSLTGADSPGSLASFQVNGGIKVSTLSDTSSPDNYCLCANGYGELARCGIYDPSQGLSCQ